MPASDTPTPVVFFDIGQTLGVPHFSPPPPRLQALEVFGYVERVLGELRDRGTRLGIISNTGQETPEAINDVLEASGLLKYFDKKLLIYSSEVRKQKNSPEIFRLAAKRAGLEREPDRCVYVGEDPLELSYAAEAGMRIASDPTLAAETLARDVSARAATPDVTSLDVCTEDARAAALVSDPGPDDPIDFAQLLTRLEAARVRFPTLYRDTVLSPYVATLKELGPAGFSRVLVEDPRRESAGGLMLDIAHAVLQNGERFADLATDAFQEVVSDLYDGFLSAQDRRGIKLPDRLVIPPLVKWGNPDFGPYTWPADATSKFGVKCAVVSLPPANARGGLVAWAALAHETAGHDILHADEGLSDELSRKVQAALRPTFGLRLANYWAQRIDETASDIMGILNMGPAAGIGLVTYFRGIRGAVEGTARLSSLGGADDPHPADVLRGYLAAATVRRLSFDGAIAWAAEIKGQTDRDVDDIRVAGMQVTPAAAEASAEMVARVIATEKMESLRNHALIEIQDWRNEDVVIVSRVRGLLSRAVPVPADLAGGVFAAHVVAAAVMEALSSGAQIPTLFARMLAVLKAMHDANPSWGPLFIAHPSSVSREYVYLVPAISQ